jgi:hypothetical protein
MVKVSKERHEKIFFDLFRGKSNAEALRVGEAIEDLKSDNRMSKSYCGGGIVVPQRLALAVMPELGSLFAAKSFSVVSTDPSASSLHQPSLERTLLMYGSDEASIFPRTLHIPAQNVGEVRWPRLDQ